MSLAGKLIISLVVAAIASALLGFFHGGSTSYWLLFAAFSAATIITSLLVTMKITPNATAASTPASQAKKPAKKPAQKPAQAAKPASKESKPKSSGKREEGEVKWFNVTKGFGFITRGNGEDIFVHFRSIRGEGRRSLRDGQRVTFEVCDSDKGPQAEDVEGLD